MQINKKLISLLTASLLTLSVVSCSSTMQTAKQDKPGFSNITDIPLPESAKMDLSKSMVMGGGDTWTGHLVYNTSRSPSQVIDFINEQMQSTGWTKLSELRGHETILTFMKEKRIATVKVTTDSWYHYNKTLVSTDMTRSNLTHVALISNEEKS